MVEKEKFKYGPLIWNHINEDDDSGNYWWPGLAPVDYDKDNIPIDGAGLQCLPLSCPVHPDYESKDSVFNRHIDTYLPTIDEWGEWFDEHFIEITEHRIKREILKWIAKRSGRNSEDFLKIQAKCETLDEMVEKVWPPDEHK